MTTVTNNPSRPAHPALNRPNTVAIGTVVWLASELMFFAGLFAMYFTLKASRPDIWADNVHILNVPFAFINTIVLVLNIKAWGMAEWFVLTFIMGAIFVCGQAYEYATLVSEGVTIASSAYGSAFYITTGFHALHVTAGLVAFLLIIGRAFVAKRFGHYEATSAIVVSYYWHFVDVVWLALFAVVYFVK